MCHNFDLQAWKALQTVHVLGSQVVLVVKNPPVNAGDAIDASLIPGSERFPWRKKWQPTPVFLPGKCHGQRSLDGYSPWALKRVGHDLTCKQQQRYSILG